MPPPRPGLHGLPAVRQQVAPRVVLPRHRHAAAYAALVVGGRYEEAGDAGRRHLGCGDVALHAAFGAHLNRFGAQGARVVNLVLPATGEGYGRVDDPDLVARLAERDPVSAALALQRQLQPLGPALLDWPDLLARDLAAEPALSLASWARQRGLAAETLSRGFARVFGTTPRRWRFELRARSALAAVVAGREPLAETALAAGYADQSALTRAVVALTGQPPRTWR